ncbi:MAG: hypothetical protein P8099_11925 [Gemmatimonadota bacterium]
MRRSLLVVLSLQLACATLAAQAAAAQAAAARPRAAQDTLRPTIRLGYARVPAPFPTRLPPAPPLPFAVRGVGPGAWGGWAAARAGAPQLRAPPWPPPLPRLAGAPLPVGPEPRSALATGVRRAPVTGTPDTARATPMRPAPVDSSVVNLLPDAVQQFADIGMRVQGRGDLGGAWIQVGGTISDRVHVDVDWDQRREFDATNNINVYYQGLKGEALQRVEVGDVSIRLPQSRYLTRGIPAGNFGFKATGRVGGMDVQAVWAQQKGDVATRQFQLNLSGAGQAGLVQDQSLVLDDADYVRGQFFFVVDPSTLLGSPNVDALTLRATDAPVTVRPHQGALAVYRDEGTVVGNFQQQAQPGFFLADAVNGGLSHSGLFRLLQPGVDYVVHPSGLWLMLRVPLRPDEALAVAYVKRFALQALVVDVDVVGGVELPALVPVHVDMHPVRDGAAHLAVRDAPGLSAGHVQRRGPAIREADHLAGSGLGRAHVPAGQRAPGPVPAAVRAGRGPARGPGGRVPDLPAIGLRPVHQRRVPGHVRVVPFARAVRASAARAQRGADGGSERDAAGPGRQHGHL